MSWQWDQITALSSVLGVVGGLISVYFLVLEVRRNALAIEGATVQSLMSFEKDVFQMLANNADVYLRGCEDISKLSAAQERLELRSRLRSDQLHVRKPAGFHEGREEWTLRSIADDDELSPLEPPHRFEERREA